MGRLLVLAAAWSLPGLAFSQAEDPARAGLDRLARRLAELIPTIATRQGRIQIAVGNFTYKDTRIAKEFSAFVQTGLEERLQARFDIIERERLDEILKEQGLQAGAIVDDGTRIPMGRIKGVEALVRGRYWVQGRPARVRVAASSVT